MNMISTDSVDAWLVEEGVRDLERLRDSAYEELAIVSTVPTRNNIRIVQRSSGLDLLLSSTLCRFVGPTIGNGDIHYPPLQVVTSIILPT